MKVVILDGSPQGGCRPIDDYLHHLSEVLEADRRQVSQFTLRDMDVRTCIGCLDCLVRTPGECSRPDAFPQVCRAAVNSDFVLLASPLRMGFPTALLKMAIERLVEGSVRSSGQMANREVHHAPRYSRYPRLGLLLAREEDTDAADIRIVSDIFSRIALAVKTTLEFSMVADQPVEQVAQAIATETGAGITFDQRPLPTSGVRVPAPSRITVFNGSPRGRRSNTVTLLDSFLSGFTSSPGRSSEIIDLVHLKEAARFPRAFAEAECVILGFPLYADSMPGIVKAFIESLEPLRGRAGNPPIGFLVQGGFPEAVHSRYVERYLEKLASRLGAPYLGTIVKGGCEIPLRETSALQRHLHSALCLNWGMFDQLHRLGRSFGETGQLDPALLRGLARPERYPGFLMPVFNHSGDSALINHYFNVQLKQHGAFERRSATPYLE